MVKMMRSVLIGRICIIPRKACIQWRSLACISYNTQTGSCQLDPTLASLRSISSNPFYFLLGLCNHITCLEKTHALFIVHGLTGDLICDTKLVSLYGSFGHIHHARLLFNQIPNPDFYAWKVMIRWYYLNNLYKEVIQFYTRMRICLKECDNNVFSIVLNACRELRDIYEGRKVHSHIIKAAGTDSFVQTIIVDMYAKCGDIESSVEAFIEFYDTDVVSWTTMIAGYVRNDYAKEGLALFNRMRKAMVEDNEYTLVTVVTACSKLGALHQGKWVHGYMIKNGFELNSFLISALLNMYVKCGNIRDARSIFNELPSIDVVSWTAMIVGYTQSSYPNEALKLFVDKTCIEILPNSFTISSVLSACAQLGNLNLGMSVQGMGVKLGIEVPTVINALVDMYSKCGIVGYAQNIFEAVSDKDVVAWNSIISGYSQNGYAYEALELFHKMRLEASPDAVTLVSVFSACASLGALQFGSCLHAYSIKQGSLLCNVYVETAVLNFYSKCGDSKCARKIFDGMENRTMVTWSAMISGYGMQGDSYGSLALFDDMMKDKLEPNEVIFTTILAACSHTGMVGEGWKYFNSMCRDYNFVPSMKHYACMVDLLARAGRLEEALGFIKNMPVKPDVSVFGAFLHGCRLHSRFDLGEVAIRRLLDLHPDEACYYVLMSNLYASAGQWSQVNQMRELMKQRQLSKSPGCSITEMDNSEDFLSSTSRVTSFA